GFTDPGLADEDGVVLGTPLKDLDSATNFVVPANDGVELATSGALGQVGGVFIERFAIGFTFGVGYRFASADRFDGGFQRLALQTGFAQYPPCLTLVVDKGKQEQLAGDVCVATTGGLFVGTREHRLQVPADLNVLVDALHLWQGGYRRVQIGHDPVHCHAGACEQAACATIRIGQQGGQHMNRLDIGVVVSDGQALSICKSLLKFGCKLVESHDPSTF